MSEEIKEIIEKYFPMDERFWTTLHAEMSMSGACAIHLQELPDGETQAAIVETVYKAKESK
jgi:hypothetical protein